MLANIVAKKENEIKEILESPKIGLMRSRYKIGREEQKILYEKLSSYKGKKPSIRNFRCSSVVIGHHQNENHYLNLQEKGKLM